MPKKESSYKFVSLPSKGECYPHHKGKVRIAPMRAIDENILADKKLREEGKAVDTLLRKLILDKDFNVDDLCVGDRNAILIHVLKENYGTKHTNPLDGAQVDLSNVNKYDFKLKADSDCCFQYEKGDLRARFRLTKRSDEKGIYELISKITQDNFKEITDKSLLMYLNITTVDINGNRDRLYINDYLNNMSRELRNEYFSFINENSPYIGDYTDYETLLVSKVVGV